MCGEKKFSVGRELTRSRPRVYLSLTQPFITSPFTLVSLVYLSAVIAILILQLLKGPTTNEL